MIRLNPLPRRRLKQFRSNRRAFWSLWFFLVLFIVSLLAEFVANDKPLLVSYRGDLYVPALQVYPETTFGGEFETEAEYPAPEVQCLIVSGGLEDCFDDPQGVIEEGILADDVADGGWIVWPLVPYSFNTINYEVVRAPSPPDDDHLLGTDEQSRDVLARVIYGFRTSVLFALAVTFASSVIGITAGAIQGYFGGLIDLIFQRIVEVWTATPALYVLIIFSALFTMNFWLLVALITFFSWTALVGVVRAEFLRARNFEYVRAARALGVGDGTIIWRHVLPNAMVATVTLMPFLITTAISTLAILDFLGLGLPASYPSLGELTLQAKQRLDAPWLAFTAFFAYAIMLSLLVFIFEGVRDAFAPRKVLA